jgi:hypothetical protein
MLNNIKIAITVVVLMAACQQPESAGSPFEMFPQIPPKRMLADGGPVEAVCYVDAERENPLNAKDYVFKGNAGTPDTQFFNYVVLAYGYLARDDRGYTHLALRPGVRHILDNSVRYIKPLHEKGIRVLVEVRSGDFGDTEDGTGTGLGTLDMAAINELTKELKLIVNQYGIDGFDFNDRGGGKTAYPPLTRNLKQFQSDAPLYPQRLFEDDEGTPLSDEAIETVLWREGGSNFSNLVQRTNEALKETFTSTYKNGTAENNDTQSLERSILVRTRNHGDHLLSQLRMAYMPDAYSGADPKVVGNLKYIVRDVPYDTAKPHASLWNEDQKMDVGGEADDRYTPFAIDLSARKSDTDAQALGALFVKKDLDSNSPENSRYGALYFTGLQPASEGDSTVYMTYFSRQIFGRNVRLSADGAGDYRKTW